MLALGVAFAAGVFLALAAADALFFAAAFLAVAWRALGRFSGLGPLRDARFALFEALRETDRRTDEIESFAEAILQKSLVAEMQRLLLVREDHEPRRRRHGLRDVINFHFVACRRRAALQIDAREPSVQLAG